MPCRNKIPLADALELWDGEWKPLQEERAQRQIVEWWWKKWPDAQIALICGKLSGVTVIDVDRKGGNEAPESFIPRYGITMTSHTGGGGIHLFCRYAQNVDNSVKALHPQIDVKTEGGYVILPPSNHESGVRYMWDPLFPFHPSNLGENLMPFPEELLLASTRAQATPTNWKAVAGGVTQGSRNVSLAKLTGKLLKTLEPEEAWMLVTAWNRQHNRPPLTDSECQNTFKSILKRHVSSTINPQSYGAKRK